VFLDRVPAFDRGPGKWVEVGCASSLLRPSRLSPNRCLAGRFESELRREIKSESPDSSRPAEI
jgi:hypothetical protein